MTAFVERDTTHLGVDRVASSVTAFALYQNLKAVLEKDPTAVAAGWKLANDYVEEAMIAAGQVSQAKLKTTFGDVSATSGAPVNLTLPGGTYGFWPQVWVSSGQIDAHIADGFNGTSPVTNIFLDTTGTAFARQRYVQASPPYDLGDGAVPLFVFALVDSSGKVLATYAAEDPPWANNGPTDIRPDGITIDGVRLQLVRPRLTIEALRSGAPLPAARIVEVTQALKQADMPLIPHPFLRNDLAGKTVVLLDPVSDLVGRLHELQRSGESLCEVLHGAYLSIGNSALARRAPPGVTPVSVTWR